MSMSGLQRDDARGSTQVLTPPHCKTGWAIKMIKMNQTQAAEAPSGLSHCRPPYRNAMSIVIISAYLDKPNMGQAEAVNMWRRPFPLFQRVRARIGGGDGDGASGSDAIGALGSPPRCRNTSHLRTIPPSSPVDVPRLSPKTRYRRAGAPPLQPNLCEHVVIMLRKVKWWCPW
ncbi:hypothetical protein BGZ61DRAFT_543951 [Ilyonectria robusta]|uniref:uncharacterized protein n=1 Tax=Ilyonectria robusta TaxID=1079257 RepID=UPI001E8CFC0A|nr:uncharacterized protein BGZ61DRAFT_543951 [Ilyonectria robusta]KAH8737740.1 hypothetical protein BGZ61DRAFT_543951 [Ilyonectria robusta]